jgi:septal ring factor EnvC (AmiA/AmiB activator)
MSIKLAALWIRVKLAWLILSGGTLPATPAPPPPPLPATAQSLKQVIQELQMALHQAFTNLDTAADAFIAECVNHVAEINAANAANAELTGELATAASNLASTQQTLTSTQAALAAAQSDLADQAAAAQAVADKLNAAAGTTTAPAPAPAPDPAPPPADGTGSADVTP